MRRQRHSSVRAALVARDQITRKQVADASDFSRIECFRPIVEGCADGCPRACRGRRAQPRREGGGEPRIGDFFQCHRYAMPAATGAALLLFGSPNRVVSKGRGPPKRAGRAGHKPLPPALSPRNVEREGPPQREGEGRQMTEQCRLLSRAVAHQCDRQPRGIED